jgi:hypothetical protein
MAAAPVATITMTRRHAAGVGVWFVVLLVAAVWGRQIPTMHLHLGDVPPLIGRMRASPRVWSLGPAAALALCVALSGPALTRRLSWRWLLVVAWVSTAAWGVTLAASDGWGRLSEPLTTRYEYLAVLPRIHGLGNYVRDFTDRLPSYPTHIKGHGPLAVVPFWALDRLGLPMPAAAAALVIAAGAAGTVAVAVTVRVTLGEEAARRLLPFLVLLPAALWIATSADAMFYGVSAGGIALLAVAGHGRGRRADASAAVAGVLIAGGLLMSYGLLVLLSLPPAVAVVQRRLRPLAIAAVTGAAVIVGFLGLGFWYLDGYRATRDAWAAGWGPQRSRSYFLVGDLGSLAVLIGPAVAAALAAVRRQAVAVLVVAAALAVLASDASGYVRGEAERIWLPLAPWLTVAACDIRWTRRATALMLLVQAGVALVVQATVRSPW